jgi:predicted permease
MRNGKHLGRPRNPLVRARLAITAWLRRRRFAHEMEEEFAFHRDMERRTLESRGLDNRTARAEADRRFGNTTRIRVACETAYLGRPTTAPSQTTSWSPEMLLQDIKYAVRTLRKQPGFLLVVCGTLALGIGANTAVFTVLNSVLLRPLPYHQPDRLVRVYQSFQSFPDTRSYLSGVDFVHFRDNVDAFDAFAAMYTYRETGFDLTGAGSPQRVRALQISSGFFEAYGATPLLGRTFTPEEDRSDQQLVILSHHIWRNVTESDNHIVGRSLVLDGSPYTVVGVMRPGFLDVVAGEIDVWVPLNLEEGGWNSRGNHYLTAIGRLRPGVTSMQAESQLVAANEALHELYGDSENDDRMVAVVPLFEDVVGETGATLFVLMGAAGLVLLIACVNVANLFLGRSIARQKEIAIRAALGSGRGRLLSQLVIEGLVIAEIGGVVGLGGTYWGVQALLAMSPESLARAEEVTFSPNLLAFTAGVTLLTGLLFSLAPGWQSIRLNVNQTLRDGGGGNSGGARSSRVRGVLVASQISLALVLLVGAGLLMKSFVALRQLQLGFTPDNATTFEVHLPTARYGEPRDRVTFHRDLHDRLSTIAGVAAVGAVSRLPVTGSYHQWGFQWIDDSGERQGAAIQVRVTEGDYFGTLGISLLNGRDFRRTDTSESEPVVILNEAAAERSFPNGGAVGKTVRFGGREQTVVGIVSNVAHGHRDALGPKIYWPHSQADDRNWALTQIVTTTAPRDDIVGLVRRELSALDADLVVYQARTMADVMGRQIAQERFALTLMGIFALVALALAAIGIYGVLSYSVNQRAREIGIRMALGAKAVQVRRIVVGQGIKLAALGIVVGLAGAVALGRLLDSMVFEVSVADPVVLVSVAIGLAAVAILASYLPARRATRVDPIDALREE